MWEKRFGLDNLRIRTRLVLLVVLLIVLFGLVAIQAHHTIIAYIEKREKIDLRDEAMNVRASFEKLLNRAESLIIENARKCTGDDPSQARELPNNTDGIKVTRKHRYDSFEELFDKYRQRDLSLGQHETDEAPREELLQRIIDDHLFADDQPQLHSYWSNLYWKPTPTDGTEGSHQKVCLQVLIRDDLRENETDAASQIPVGRNPIWFYEVDLTEPLAHNILWSVRSYGILVNPGYTHWTASHRGAASNELAYVPILKGSPSSTRPNNPSQDEVLNDDQSSKEEKTCSVTMGAKLRQAISRHDEKIEEQIRLKLQVEDFSFQFPPAEELPEGGDSGISLRDLIVIKCDDKEIPASTPWTCKSSFISSLVANKLNDISEAYSTKPTSRQPLRKVSIEKGQNPRIWLRAGSHKELEELKATVAQFYENAVAGSKHEGNQQESLRWESETSMGNLVLSIASIRPPGASPECQPILYIARAVSLEEIRNSAQEGLSPLIYWGVFISALALALTVTLAFRITQPLQQITKVVGQIQETDINAENSETEDQFKKLLTELPVARNDEVGAISKQLAKTFESILDKNKQIRFQLERSNKSDLERRVAEEASEAKTNFLAMISHDMRQSMNVMFGHLAILQDQCCIPEQLQDIQAVFMSAKKMRYLIDDVLDYQRFLTGDVHVESREFNVEQMLKSVVDIYRSNAEENGNQIVLQSFFHQTIASDEPKLERIVGNLLSNACKFTKRGKITVLLEQVSPTDIRISVEDTGKGMGKEQQAKVFQIQNTAKTTGNRDGTGLGLYICKRLATSLHGKIGFESVENKGTRFEIRLPIRSVSEDPSGMDQKTSSTREQELLLIIDDSQTSREAIRQAVESHSKDAFKIIEASNGHQGLRLAREYSPSLITLDVEMPDINGFQVLQELRENPITARIPVILVTIHADTGTASVLGANGFLKKPFDRNELWRQIERSLAGARDGLVLLVDDEESCRKELSKLLSSRGIRVSTARDGEDALDRIQDEIPSLFIIDLLMPRMDGFALIEKLRSMPETKNVPILVLSALALQPEEMNKLNPMIQRFFGKGSMDLSEFISEIDRISSQESNRLSQDTTRT